MSAEGRWVRLNCDTLLTEWLDELGYPFNLIWPVVMTHVKQHGNNRGSCKTISAKLFGRMYGIPEADVQKLLDAAATSGAMKIGNEWTLTGWNEYQSPDAGRKRNERVRTTADTSGHPEAVRDNPDLSVTNGSCPVSCHATETETRTYIDANASTGGGSDGREPNHVWDPIARVICQAAESCGWPIPTNDQLKTDVARYLKPGSAIAQLINAYGEDGAVERFVWIHEHWSVSASWELAWSKRNQVDDEMLGRRVIATRAPTRKASSSNTLETYNALLEGSEIWKAQQQAA